MPNLIKIIENIPDEDLRLQIALFEMINFQNLIKEKAFKAAGLFKEAFYKLAGRQMSENTGEEQTLSNEVKTLINTRIRELKGMEKTQLRAHLIRLLAERVKLPQSDQEKKINEDILSISLIRQSAAEYGLDAHIAPGHLAEQVRDRYQEQFLNRLHKNLVKETIQERKITDNNLQFYLNKASIEDIRELNRRVKLGALSGQGIGRLLRTEKGTENLRVIIECIGMNAFDAVQVFIMMAFDSVLGVNRFTRILFAQLIWNSLRLYEKRFRIYRDTLPSYILTTPGGTVDEKEKKFFSMETRRADLQVETERLNSEMKIWNENMLECQDKIEIEREKFNHNKNRLDQLGTERAVYEADGVKTPAEIKKYYADVIAAQKGYNRSKIILDKLSNQLKELKLKLEKNNAEYVSCKSELERVVPLCQEGLIERTQLIKGLWTQHYKGVEFSEGFFVQIAKQFRYIEILEIEELLEELYQSSDSVAYADETILCEEGEKEKTLWYTVKCLVSQGVYASLIYKNGYMRSIIKI